MTAKDAIFPQNTRLTSPQEDKKAFRGQKKPIIASAPLTMALERMASGEEVVTVIDDVTEAPIGVIDHAAMIKAIAGLFPQLDESAELTITCPPKPIQRISHSSCRGGCRCPSVEPERDRRHRARQPHHSHAACEPQPG